MSTAPWTVGRYVVELLAANGIDTVFGIPGLHTLELYRGLAATGMRHVLVHHEQNAGFAADGYARMSGRPAAAFVISGPGLTNILTSVGQAYSDSVPMLVVASAPTRPSLGKGWGVLHELKDQRALAAGVTGTARTTLSAGDVHEHLRAALASLEVGRARPAYVEIPLDLLAETTALRPERFEHVAGWPQPDSAQIDRASALLAASRRPLIVAGGGARAAGAVIRQLVEWLDGYLVTTAAGKGVLPESHPANLGSSLQFRETQELVASADVVLAAGTELSETDVYTTTRLQQIGKLIRIDVDPIKLSDHYAADIAIWGDARSSLEAIVSRAMAHAGAGNETGASSRECWRTQLGTAATHRTQIEKRFDARTTACLRALRAIREGLPADGVVCSDMTQIAYLGNYAFATDHPGTWFHPSGFGALGYALPAAIGAKLADERRAVIALAGDFGLQYTLQELMTAVELELNLPIVVWNNAALGQIRDDMRAAKIPPVGVTARNPDFVALAHAYGAEGVRPREPQQLTAAISAALERRGPTLVEVHEGDFLPG